jgi:hypothetical protein
MVLVTGLAEGFNGDGHTVFLPLVLNQYSSADKYEYGLNFVSSADSQADAARYSKAISTGAGWNRWPLYWYNVETSSGVFDWSYGDPVVQADRANGFKTELILMGTPGFYATGGSADQRAPQVGEGMAGWEHSGFTALAPTSTAATSPRGLFEPVFADGSDTRDTGKAINADNPWAVFVAEVVAHYSPMGITNYEIWNEEDYDFFWAGTEAEYAQLLKVAYLAAKSVNPEAQIIFGGLANFQQPNFLAEVLAILAQDPDVVSHNWYFDILATHSYGTAWESWKHVWRAEAALRNHGLAKEIWLNESGSPAWNDYPGPTWDPESIYRSTMEEGAAYVIQSALYAKYAGASVIFHFQLYDDCGNDPAGTDFPPAEPPSNASSVCEIYDPCGGDAFGLIRNRQDGDCYTQHPEPDTARPAFDAFQVLTDHLTGLKPLWRSIPSTYEEIAFYRPSTKERVLALWSLVGTSQKVKVESTGSSAQLIDQEGTVTNLTPTDGVYTLDLEPATNQNSSTTPWSAYSIGGPPLILVETDTQAPQVEVNPMPTLSPPGIPVTWGGQDIGSGIQDYDIWVFEDAITMTAWLTNTTTEHAFYPGEKGATYGFAVTGRDWAGNQNPLPPSPQAITTVAQYQTYLPTILRNSI